MFSQTAAADQASELLFLSHYLYFRHSGAAAGDYLTTNLGAKEVPFCHRHPMESMHFAFATAGDAAFAGGLRHRPRHGADHTLLEHARHDVIFGEVILGNGRGDFSPWPHFPGPAQSPQALASTGSGSCRPGGNTALWAPARGP